MTMMRCTPEQVQTFLAQFEQLWNQGAMRELRQRYFGAWHTALMQGNVLRHECGDEVLANLHSQREFFAQLGLSRCRPLQWRVEAVQAPWYRLDVQWRFEPGEPASFPQRFMDVRWQYVLRCRDQVRQIVVSNALDLRRAYDEFAVRLGASGGEEYGAGV